MRLKKVDDYEIKRLEIPSLGQLLQSKLITTFIFENFQTKNKLSQNNFYQI